MPELEFRAKMMLSGIRCVADAERPLFEGAFFKFISDMDIIACGPSAVRSSEMPHQLCLFRIFKQLAQRALALVVILAGKVNDRLPFHVRLACKNEHSNGGVFRRHHKKGKREHGPHQTILQIVKRPARLYQPVQLRLA